MKAPKIYILHKVTLILYRGTHLGADSSPIEVELGIGVSVEGINIKSFSVAGISLLVAAALESFITLLLLLFQ